MTETVLLHEEHDGGVTVLEVFQPWEGAGLRWRCTMDAGPLGTLRGQSGGAFYTDQHGETIHGATRCSGLACASTPTHTAKSAAARGTTWCR